MLISRVMDIVRMWIFDMHVYHAFMFISGSKEQWFFQRTLSARTENYFNVSVNQV